MNDIVLDPIAAIISSMEDDSAESEIVVKAKREPGENFVDQGANPVEDKYGRSLWVQTRLCFCPDNALTDCRFHSTKEPGWETCPHLEKAKIDNRIKGRWLWARNPLYNKPLTNEEVPGSEAVVQEPLAKAA